MHPKGLFRSRQGRKAAIQIALWRPDTRIGFLLVRKADFLVPEGAEEAAVCPGAAFFVKFEVPQRQQLFCAPEGAGGGCCVPVAPENAPRTTQEPVFRTRISAPYQRRGFPVPNITSVPEKPIFYTECFRKRVAYHRRGFLRTARIFRTTGGLLRYRMPQTQRSHILRRRLPRHQHPHYSHALITDIRLMEAAWDKKQPLCGKNLCNFFKKLRELSRSFFIFVPNKYRNTQCKLFTTNTTNSWNLPR